MSDDAIYCNQWIRFSDNRGVGYAQPDAFILLPDRIILFECKLTQCMVGPQVLGLYAPLLRRIYSKPITPILVCKNLRRAPPARFQIESLEQAIQAKPEVLHTWHWLP